MSNEGKKEEVKLQEAITQLLKEKKALTVEEIENLKAQNRLNEAYFEDLKRQETIIMELAKQKATALTEEGKLQEKFIEGLKTQIKLTDEEVAMLSAAEDGQEALLELQQQRKKLREEEAEMTRQIESSVGGLATKIGIGNSALTKSVIKYRDMAKNIANSKKLQDKLANSIKQTFSAGMILGRIVENTIALAFAVDKASAAFASATGTGREFEFQIGYLNDVANENMVTFDKAMASLQSVNQELIGGAQMSKDMQREIAEQTMGFSRFGIEAATVTKIMNDMHAKALARKHARARKIRHDRIHGNDHGKDQNLTEFLKSLGSPILTEIYGKDKLQAMIDCLDISVSEKTITDLLKSRHGTQILSNKVLRGHIFANLDGAYINFLKEGKYDENTNTTIDDREKLIKTSWNRNINSIQRLIEIFDLEEDYLPQKVVLKDSTFEIKPSFTLFPHQKRVKDKFDRAKFSSIIFDPCSGLATIQPAEQEAFYQTQFSATFDAYLD